MSIYTILASKPHNPHYLNRYVSFIESCRKVNEGFDGYTEKHHICPKAKDLFPEYKSFDEYPWNLVELTARQHFIAHWMLWKAYGKSQAYAFKCFVDQIDCKNNQRSDLKVTSKIYEELKTQSTTFMSAQAKGKAAYVDREGNKVYCRTDDPRVVSGELVSTTKGRNYQPRSKKQRDNTKKSLIEYHLKNGTTKEIHLYKGVERVTVRQHTEEYENLLREGWSTKCTPERRSLISIEANKNRKPVRWSEESRKKFSERIKGRKQSTQTKIKKSKHRRVHNDAHYEIMVYDVDKNEFLKIDKLFFNENKHIKVNKQVKNKSKKAIDIETKEVKFINPDLPFLPPNFVFLENYRFVKVLDVSNKTIYKIRKYLMKENHIEISVTEQDRALIRDSKGNKFYVPKAIMRLYFS